VSWVLRAFAFACLRERLAGVTACDDVGSLDFLPVDFFDVAMVRYLGPMFFENLATVFVNFGLPNYFHACAFEA
jgi:hypothetical protein